MLRCVPFDFLPLLRVIVMLLLIVGATQRINADNSAAVNRSVPACKLPRMPLLCDNKLLRYTYNPATGNCVSQYTSGCVANTITKYFLTFEECRRDNMPIMRY